MQEHPLYCPRIIIITVLAVERHLEAVVGIQVFFCIACHINSIVKSLGSLRVVKLGCGLFNLVRRNSLGGIIHHRGIHPHVNALQIFRFHRVTEPYPETSRRIAFLGTRPQDTHIGSLPVEQEFDRAVIIGACSQDKRQKRPPQGEHCRPEQTQAAQAFQTAIKHLITI